MALEKAYYDGLLDKNFSGALQKKMLDPKEDTPLSQEQQKILVEKAGEFKPILLGYLWTGCRLSELLTLKKNYYNQKDQTIFINGTKTKTSKRTIPVLSPLKEVFDVLLEQNPEDERLFCLSEKTLKRKFTIFQKQFDFKFSIKTFRHTFNQNLKDMEIDDFVRANWLGHSKPATTNKVYTHMTDNLQRKAIEKIKDTLKDTLNTDK